ncbi:unnamed protein product [Rangifer tarandus platyrhynchus]|uniref:Uncharacterized protein n=2 Tax=Rangifer tarandus platyrhynchus TaxID=3082113 RepID=A0AC59YB48_RANTA|nr:unnamed protein product [Rangifer tarandus platyrhynchus]
MKQAQVIFIFGPDCLLLSRHVGFSHMWGRQLCSVPSLTTFGLVCSLCYGRVAGSGVGAAAWTWMDTWRRSLPTASPSPAAWSSRTMLGVGRPPRPPVGARSPADVAPGLDSCPAHTACSRPRCVVADQ